MDITHRYTTHVCHLEIEENCSLKQSVNHILFQRDRDRSENGDSSSKRLYSKQKKMQSYKKSDHRGN